MPWHWLPGGGREQLKVGLFEEGVDKPVAAVLNGGLHVVPIELPHLVRWLGEAGDDVDLVSQSDQEAPPFPPCFASL